MTREQLEELKKLLAVFWDGSIPYNPKLGVEIADRALPLIEALEEAWKERDEAREQVKVLSAYSGERHAFHRTADGKLSGLVVDKDGPWVRACDARTTEQERDEARAEVERLRDVVRQVHALAAQGDDLVHGWIDPTLREIHKITKGMVE